MMVPAPLWRELGGLSSYLEPMYFEDTAFAFKVRAAGYSTWFVPASVVYHYEGMTSGTDVTTGFKKYQEVNRPKFKRQWAADFANFGAEGQAPAVGIYGEDGSVLEAFVAEVSAAVGANDRAALKEKAGGLHVSEPVSYTHLRAHETVLDLVCRLLLEQKKHQ